MNNPAVEIGRIIKERMEELDYSFNTLANLTGVSKSALQRYTTEQSSKIPINKLKAIAAALRLDPVQLMGWDASEPSVTEDVVKLPVLGDVAAGYEHLCIQNWEGDSIEIPRSYLKGRPLEDYFMLRVQGDSMYPLYLDGDIVLVLKQKTLNRSGDIGVIRYDAENATLKKVEYVMGEDWMKLIPINPQYPPMLIENEALEECSVLGVPRMVIREIA